MASGIAADAAGRGLSVFLCEKDDLASHTSSASSKLIHGGLRYLEHYEFRLVREALAEREVLLAKAPHIVKPMRFVLPHRPHLRPAWMIRAGLFLYDHLGKRKNWPARKACVRPRQPAEKRNHPRLRILRLLGRRRPPGGTQRHGRPGKRRTHSHPTRCVSASAQRPVGNELERADGSLFSIRAKALVNAAGPGSPSSSRTT
jgi:glycerol-3-phosphate dehydrogenase